MAEEQVGMRRDNPRELPAWMKLFTAFKVALDPKKLLLAAAGIVVMAFGWWLLAALFFTFNPRPPAAPTDQDIDKETWDDLKIARSRWNLLYEMAGPTPVPGEDGYRHDAFDLATTPAEYRQLVKAKDEIEAKVGKRLQKVTLGHDPDWKTYWLLIGDKQNPTTLYFKTDKDALDTLKDEVKRGVRAGDLRVDLPDAKTAWVRTVQVTTTDPEKWLDFYNKNLKNTYSLRTIEDEIKEKTPKDREAYLRALTLIDPNKARYKPSGRLRTWPWFEDRGPNPYLLVTGKVHSEGTDGSRNVPWERGQFAGWFMSDQLPVLLEPLLKFLSPILYLFHPASGGWNRIYLFFVILWTLLTWALFGGAITRMAAVQVARPTEKVGLTEAVRFAWSHYKSFFSAPLFPLIFIVVLTVFLIVFGLVEEFTWFFGDIVVAGLFWPLVLLVGLIMAVVLVGLVGWPMMYATISTEGSDSFDAISRSYSYVYQAPWQYLWYSFVALLYGAVLVLFVGFMGSLMVYLGKWGVSQTPGPQSREPTYLFVNAPTSFGWRDLLLAGHPAAETVEVVRGNGSVGKTLRLNEQYMETMSVSNWIGAFLVSVWIYLLFLMVVGFGYSYFWTASTIIYLLMRRKVDDTEMDEVHLEEEEFEEPAPKPAAAAGTVPTPATAGAAAGGLPRQMVETPSFRPAAPPVQTVAATAPPVIPAPTPTAGPITPPPTTSPKTQLAPEPLPEGKDGPSAAPPTGPGEGGSTGHTGGPGPDEGKP